MRLSPHTALHLYSCFGMGNQLFPKFFDFLRALESNCVISAFGFRIACWHSLCMDARLLTLFTLSSGRLGSIWWAYGRWISAIRRIPCISACPGSGHRPDSYRTSKLKFLSIVPVPRVELYCYCTCDPGGHFAVFFFVRLKYSCRPRSVYGVSSWCFTAGFSHLQKESEVIPI